MKQLIPFILLLTLLLVSCATQDIDNMIDEEKEIAMAKEMEKNPPVFLDEDEVIQEKIAVSEMSGSLILKSGQFVDKAHPTSGEVQIVQANGHNVLIFSEDFMSDKGPQLVVIASEHENPQNSQDLHTGNYVELGKLKTTSGPQMYNLPQGEFNSVAIYCKPFKVLFGVASLSK
jgi:hypothetical protein